MDLSIEMTSQTTYLEDALSDYTHVERLDKDNKWHCGRCQGKVKADKQLTIRAVRWFLSILFFFFETYPSPPVKCAFESYPVQLDRYNSFSFFFFSFFLS